MTVLTIRCGSEDISQFDSDAKDMKQLLMLLVYLWWSGLWRSTLRQIVRLLLSGKNTETEREIKKYKFTSWNDNGLFYIKTDFEMVWVVRTSGSRHAGLNLIYVLKRKGKNPGPGQWLRSENPPRRNSADSPKMAAQINTLPKSNFWHFKYVSRQWRL